MANLTRYHPIDELFNEFTRGFWVKPLSARGESDLQMRIDVKEDDKAFTVQADMPGVRKEDIQIDIDDDQVTLCAETKQEKEEKEGENVVYSERSYGMVRRSFTLPMDVDEKGARAEYKDGVLHLTLPKKKGGSAKRISVA